MVRRTPAQQGRSRQGQLPRWAWIALAAGTPLGLVHGGAALAGAPDGEPPRASPTATVPSASSTATIAPSSSTATLPSLSSTATVPSPSSTATVPSPSSTATIAAAPGPSEEDRAAASRAFKEGERLFEKGDYLVAAASFEEAYRLAPHDASLWNAARSWHRAGELSRAANRYSHFLEDAPQTSPDRDEATRAVQELAKKLGRFDVQAQGLTDVRVDGAAVRLPVVYVVPGAHVLSALAGDREIRRTERVEAGMASSVVLAPDPVAPATASASATAVPSATPPVVTVVVKDQRAPFPLLTPARVSTLVAGVASLVLLGFTVASGMDTLSARADYDKATSNSEKRKIFEDGVAKQQTTNALLGATIGGFALTGFGVFWVVALEPKRADGAQSATLVVGGDF
ncbi:MAG: hypothetical protein R3B70_19045 [Polyangiaceae bacterium]